MALDTFLCLGLDMLLSFREDRNGVTHLLSGLTVGDNHLEIIRKALEAKHLSQNQPTLTVDKQIVVADVDTQGSAIWVGRNIP